MSDDLTPCQTALCSSDPLFLVRYLLHDVLLDLLIPLGVDDLDIPLDLRIRDLLLDLLSLDILLDLRVRDLLLDLLSLDILLDLRIRDLLLDLLSMDILIDLRL